MQFTVLLQLCLKFAVHIFLFHISFPGPLWSSASPVAMQCPLRCLFGKAVITSHDVYLTLFHFLLKAAGSEVVIAIF